MVEQRHGRVFVYLVCGKEENNKNKKRSTNYRGGGALKRSLESSGEWLNATQALTARASCAKKKIVRCTETFN